MSADTLRRAAALMRERAEAATPGPWEVDHFGHGVRERSGRGLASAHNAKCEVAAHIASWHPAVAMAVAEWLEVTARDVGTSSLAFHAATAAATAYLGDPTP